MTGQLETLFTSTHDNEATLRAVLAASPLAISWSDSEGRIEFWNRKALDMFGYSFEEISTIDLWMLRAYPDPLYRAEVKTRWSAAIVAGKQRAAEFNGGEYDVTCKDGTVRNVEIIGNHFDNRLMVIFTDITERKRIEGELTQYRVHLEELVRERTGELERSRKRAESLLAESSRLREHAEQVAAALKRNEAEVIRAKNAAEAANRTKSTFLSSMSHELRTPLNSILGFAQILRTDARLPQSSRESVNIIVRAGEHLLNLINDVLEISRIESEKGSLSSQDFVPTQWARETLTLLEERIQQKDIQLLFLQSSALPGMIRSDRDKLRRILVNLVDNAIKFTEKGRISVQMSCRPQPDDGSRSLLVLDIEDTGIGISPADLTRLFKPFEQLGPGAVNAGTGLGLTIVRHYVDMMKGTITVNSNPGVGSCFHVEIPVQVIQDKAVDSQVIHARHIMGNEP